MRSSIAVMSLALITMVLPVVNALTDADWNELQPSFDGIAQDNQALIDKDTALQARVEILENRTPTNASQPAIAQPVEQQDAPKKKVSMTFGKNANLKGLKVVQQAINNSNDANFTFGDNASWVDDAALVPPAPITSTNAPSVSSRDNQGIAIAPGPEGGNPVYGQPSAARYKVCYDPRRPGYSYLVDQVTGAIVDRQYSMSL